MVDNVSWYMNTIKSEHRLDLVLETGLLLDHVSSGPKQAAIFDFYPRGNIDSFEFSVSVVAGKFAAIYLISLPARSLSFVGTSAGFTTMHSIPFSRNCSWIQNLEYPVKRRDRLRQGNFGSSNWQEPTAWW